LTPETSNPEKSTYKVHEKGTFATIGQQEDRKFHGKSRESVGAEAPLLM